MSRAQIISSGGTLAPSVNQKVSIPQSVFIFAILIFLFIVYITVKGQLSTYLGIIGLGPSPIKAGSTSTASSAASNTSTLQVTPSNTVSQLTGALNSGPLDGNLISLSGMEGNSITSTIVNPNSLSTSTADQTNLFPGTFSTSSSDLFSGILPSSGSNPLQL